MDPIERREGQLPNGDKYTITISPTSNKSKTAKEVFGEKDEDIEQNLLQPGLDMMPDIGIDKNI